MVAASRTSQNMRLRTSRGSIHPHHGMGSTGSTGSWRRVSSKVFEVRGADEIVTVSCLTPSDALFCEARAESMSCSMRGLRSFGNSPGAARWWSFFVAESKVVQSGSQLVWPA